MLDVQERGAAAIARISAVYKAEGDYVAAAADADDRRLHVAALESRRPPPA